MRTDLHSALKTQVIADFRNQTTRFVQVRLQYGKDQFTETLHVSPSSYTSAGLQLTDLLSLVGFERNVCAFIGSECYARQIATDFDVQGFADAFNAAYADLNEGVRHLEACGVLVPRPEGWGYFHGRASEHSHRGISNDRGDGHTGAKSERMKESQDQYFRYVFSWLDGSAFKGWVTHYRPHHWPLSAEFDAALEFLGGFHHFNNCPEFDFETCYWRSMEYGDDRGNRFNEPAQSAHRFFDSHATNFSVGIEKLLAVHSRLARFGISILNVSVSRPREAPVHRPPATAKVSPPANKPGQGFKYDVAISFAGTERSHAEAVAKFLRSAGLMVFYDDFYPEQLWGKDLAAEFDRIYRKESRFCLMFVSAEYATRIWTTHERRSALARLVQENGKEYILPVRVDSTDLDGLSPSIGYVSLADKSIDEIGKLLVSKLKAQSSTH
jgi:hypothetical protein